MRVNLKNQMADKYPKFNITEKVDKPDTNNKYNLIISSFILIILFILCYLNCK